MAISISPDLSAAKTHATYNTCMSRLFPLSILLLLALHLSPTAALGQPASSASTDDPQALAEFVQRAIRYLDSPQLQQRQQAEQALVERGPRVLDLLPTDMEPYSSEIQTRLNRIRQILYEEVAIQTSRGSTVSLSGTYRLNDVLKELELQTGNVVVANRELGEAIELELAKTPFHQALDNILDLGHLDIEPYFAPHPNQILIKPRLEGLTDRQGRAHYTGPFRFEIVKVSSTRNLRVPAAANCSLSLQIIWEPRVRPLYLTLPTDSLQAVDNTGSELAPLIRGEKTLNVEGTAPLVEVEIPFSLPAANASQLRVLQGTISAMVPGRKEHFEFSNLQAASSFPKQQRRAGVTVTLTGVRQTAQQTSVDLEIHYKDAGNAFESHRGWTNRNHAYLADGDQMLEIKPRRETIAQKKQSVTYRFTFDTTEALQGLTFHYHTPALLLEKEVEFELHDIPLP